MGDGLLVIDATSRIVEANRAALRILGVRRTEEVLGPLAQGLYARCTRADGSPLHREDLGVYRVLRDGEPARGELLTRDPAGDPRTYESLTTPIVDGGGVLGATMTLRDVTDQRRREREARFVAQMSELAAASLDAQATLATLADRCVDELADWCSVYLFDEADGLLRQVAFRHRDPKLANSLAAELGRRPLRVGDGFVGAAVRAGQTLILPDLTEEVVARYARGSREAGLVRKLGLRGVVAAPLRGAHGVVGALSVGWRRRSRQVDQQDARVVDEIARRAALAVEQGRGFQALEEALGRLELVLDAMAAGLVIFGSDGRTILVNAYARSLFPGAGDVLGLTAEEWLRRGASGFTNPTAGIEVAARLADREVADRGELRVERPTPRDLEWTSAPVREADGAVVGQVVVLADLTHIRAVERVREEFAADCSGDLRTFASAISTYAGHALRRVRRSNADTTLVHQLEGIIRNARQVSNLVGDLLDAARIEVGGGELAPSEVDVVPLVEQAIDQARAMTTRHRFRLDVPASLPPAYCDPNLVRRALVNVLSNAIKYWPDGGQIGVRIRPQLDGIFISVRDRGLGIPPDRLQQVFERFFRVVDDPARRGIRGNGLGLYLVREVIEAHGGTAWIESTGVAGEPTTVHLLLPWRPAPSDDRA